MFLKAKITNFSYFKNLKESMVFTKEQRKTSGSLASIWCCIEPWLHIILSSFNILKTNGYVVIYQMWRQLVSIMDSKNHEIFVETYQCL
jgi:hypothetical protein